ncbi:MAG: ribonuclease R [Hyphomicrobiaceae bacterium]|nr:ribonuclease R [Hyphomicrobiaceae bacterium]
MSKDSRRPRKSAGKPSVRKERDIDGGLPTREQILEFVRRAPAKVGKREIARAFGVKGGDRIALKQLLAEMADEGLLTDSKKAIRQPGHLPPVAVLEVCARDGDGDLVAEPVVWDDEEGPRPRVLILPTHRADTEDTANIGIGDRVLARIEALAEADVEGYRFEAEPIRKLPRDQRRLLGIFRAHPKGGGSIEPIDRKALRSWSIQKSDQGDASDGDLVRFDLAKRGRFAVPQARILEVLGNPDDQRQISLIAIHAHGLPDGFPESVLLESESLPAPKLQGREDLRDIPLLTIDPADARDHDDAVYAEPDTSPGNEGGFVVLVAIADVAHYVRPGSRLDREARVRGNSVYFPDRVVPMLPERISNDLCSLREGEDRPCLVARMVFDKRGEKRSQKFFRAMMRSAAKLSYQEAQAAFDGDPGEKAAPLMEPALLPLWTAYQALAAARDRRGPLDLDLPEKKIKLDKEGRVERVVVPERLAAHRLIEEFMIQANVAAAEALEARKSPVVYRAHAAPSKEKLKSLREFLETLDLKLPADASLKPADFNRVLERAKDLPVPELVNEVVLRSQAQAEYAIENYGHFGLHLSRYAHFTSPIRRYADLLVHRSLVRALQLGEGGLADEETPRLAETAKMISEAERRAMAAERETIDRLIASHLADRVGASFNGRIAGVTRSGLFVKLDDTGADGFVPVSSLISDFYNHIEEAHALLGARSNAAYRLGMNVEVRLVEAIPSAGALRFEMLTPPEKGALGPVKGGKRLNVRRIRPQHGRRR